MYLHQVSSKTMPKLRISTSIKKNKKQKLNFN